MKQPDFLGLLNTSKFALILRCPKKHCDPPVKVGLYRGNVNNKILTP